ncbi:MAG: PEP-CTERM sorting domain-containing protein [Boseongicola sp.]|nr:PEP-CTERM sorting domain-containing protein [Boseongicola sp.]
MNKTIRKLAALAALALPVSAMADPVIVVLPDGNSPATVGGYTMTAFNTSDLQTTCKGTGAVQFRDNKDVGPLRGVTSVKSPINGDIEFHNQGGNSPLCVGVDDPGNATWWEHADHGTVFTTTRNWIELVMPADTRAFSLFVGGVSGIGWIEAIVDGVSVRQDFGGNSGIAFGAGHTPGFGVYSTDKCSSISKIIIEPHWEWGPGHFAINQDPCSHEVPEPAPMLLLMTGLFGLALSRRFNKTVSSTS